VKREFTTEITEGHVGMQNAEEDGGMGRETEKRGLGKEEARAVARHL
jgi:hypothetical protein